MEFLHPRDAGELQKIWWAWPPKEPCVCAGLCVSQSMQSYHVSDKTWVRMVTYCLIWTQWIAAFGNPSPSSLPAYCPNSILRLLPAKDSWSTPHHASRSSATFNLSFLSPKSPKGSNGKIAAGFGCLFHAFHSKKESLPPRAQDMTPVQLISMLAGWDLHGWNWASAIW